MMEHKRNLLLVGLDDGFVDSFVLSDRMAGYRVERALDAVSAVKCLSSTLVDAVVFRFDQPMISWDAFLEIVRAIHSMTRIVVLFDGSCEEELCVLASSVDLCLSVSKTPALCFEYIHRLFEQSLRAAVSDTMVSSRGLNNFEVDLKTECVTKNGSEIALTHLEYLILVSLIQNSDKTLNRQEIFQSIYKHEDEAMAKKDRRIDMHIAKLRQKIGAPHIRSIRGRGYRWDAL